MHVDVGGAGSHASHYNMPVYVCFGNGRLDLQVAAVSWSIHFWLRDMDGIYACDTSLISHNRLSMISFILRSLLQIAIKNLNKEVATKEYLSKFLPREIEILQMVGHPNIVQVFQIIETEKKAFIMLELAENGDLLDYINSRRYLNESEARFIFRQMSSGIAFCHSLDIIHRDLKCENIMLSKDMDVKIGGMQIIK